VLKLSSCCTATLLHAARTSDLRSFLVTFQWEQMDLPAQS
jgi:hypothetical protein